MVVSDDQIRGKRRTHVRTWDPCKAPDRNLKSRRIRGLGRPLPGAVLGCTRSDNGQEQKSALPTMAAAIPALRGARRPSFRPRK